VALLDSPITGPVNLASGAPVAVRDLVAEIALATDRAELLELGALPQRAGEPPRIVADVRRLREEVGFRPELDLAGGVAAAVEALRRLA
jgi:nucleoside-diphosphate-sugar epimerase